MQTSTAKTNRVHKGRSRKAHGGYTENYKNDSYKKVGSDSQIRVCDEFYMDWLPHPEVPSDTAKEIAEKKYKSLMWPMHGRFEVTEAQSRSVVISENCLQSRVKIEGVTLVHKSTKHEKCDNSRQQVHNAEVTTLDHTTKDVNKGENRK